VAESPVKGGAMSTARQALSYSRNVLAIPGRPEDSNYTGCNMLIKQNIAALVENVSDILEAVNWEPIPTRPHQTSIDFFSASNDEDLIKQTLTNAGEQNIDQLHQLTRIPVHDLSVLLLKLELEGIVTQLPGKCYSLI
ncbi:MAG TPA: DNA-processing protein DprA, partial [Butyricimonas virosa]|jgi:smf protein DNA processing chain A|nr:DNA-processing protein DprA [Butyricimonas virosa]